MSMHNPSRKFNTRPYSNNASSNFWEVTDHHGLTYTTNPLSKEQASAVVQELHRIVRSTGEGVTYNAAVQVELSITSGVDNLVEERMRHSDMPVCALCDRRHGSDAGCDEYTD